MTKNNSASSPWSEYEAYIRKLCTYKLSSMPGRIDDCVQDVFLDFGIAVNSGKEITNCKAWLTTVAYNKIIDIYKEEKKNSEKTVPFSGELLNEISPSSSLPPEDILISEDRIYETKEAFLSSLSPEESALFNERYVSEKTCREIAGLLGITETNVRKKLFRLRQKAKKFAEEQFND